MRRGETGRAGGLSELPAGPHRIAETQVTVSRAPNGPLHFASRATGHDLVRGFQPADFKLWYDASVDRIAPLLLTGFTAPAGEPVLDELRQTCRCANLTDEARGASARLPLPDAPSAIRSRKSSPAYFWPNENVKPTTRPFERHMQTTRLNRQRRAARHAKLAGCSKVWTTPRRLFPIVENLRRDRIQ